MRNVYFSAKLNSMKKLLLAIAFTSLVSTGYSQNKDSLTLKSFFSSELKSGKSYPLLKELCEDIGPRLSGSENAAKAVKWAEEKMKEFKFDKVYLQEVMVPHWERGKKEEGIIISKSFTLPVPTCALGGSVATNGKLLTGIVEVKSLEELEALGTEKVKGKFVFFNRPMDPTKINTFEAYGPAVAYRGMGANEASKYGAAGVIIRSVNVSLDDYPHTGAMRPYDPQREKIPACAISTNAAELLSKLLEKDPQLTFSLDMTCQTLPDAKSYNVIGELKGTEFPEEIIVVGGHLDSWDLAQGAHDDGAGCVQSMEALRLFKENKIQPKRTIRCVLFMNEENGLRGGIEYAKQSKLNKEKHIAAMESDEGGFTPRGFGFDADSIQFEKINSWKPLFAPYNILEFKKGGGGADIGPLKDQGPVLISYIPDSQRYFDFHHSALDKIEGVNKRELELGAASLSALLYLISQYGL